MLYGCAMSAITASEARRTLFGLIEQVNDDNEAVEILSKRGTAILMSEAEYKSLMETANLLRVPANAKRLLESLEQARKGDTVSGELVE